MDLSLEEIEFLEESNAIEREYSSQALKDAQRAWIYSKTLLGEDFKVGWILGIHKRLMENINKRIAGHFRKCDVWIAGEHKPFISEQEFKHALDNWCEKVNNQVFLTKDIATFDEELALSVNEELSRAAHVWFEEIHPFEDGNGRTGRILYNLHRLKLGLPLHVIHEGPEQMEYYGWFKTYKNKQNI